MYKAITRDIEVTVEPFYLEEQSNPEENRYVWGYRITIANESEVTVQLRARYWKITDGNGHVEEVRGPGVIGEQPILNPGEVLPVFFRLSADDNIRRHGRPLYNADRQRRTF